MPQIHLLIGPVGAGKTTFAAQLATRRDALVLNLDAWMANLFRPDRPADANQVEVMAWYAERVERCIDQIWEVTRGALAAGTEVVLEIGLIRRLDRERFYARVDAEAVDMRVYLVDAPREVRRARVLQRNRDKGATHSMDVPPEIFELASDMWEAPSEQEIEDRGIETIESFSPG